MRTATFSDLRNKAKEYFDAVERGETIEVYRHGKPLATISPYAPPSSSRWKTVKPLVLKGVSLSKAIMSGRREDR